MVERRGHTPTPSTHGAHAVLYGVIMRLSLGAWNTLVLMTFLTLGGGARALAQSVPMTGSGRAITPSTAAPAYPMLTLDEVVERALAVSPNVALGAGGVRTAQSTQRVARGAYLPTLSLTSAATTTDASSTSSTASSVTSLGAPRTLSNQTLGVGASMDLFTGGRRQADEAFAHAELVAARSTLVSARYTAALTAQQAFYEVVRATEFVGVARTALAEAERLLRYTQAMSRAGTAMRSDLLRAQLQVTTMDEQLVAANDTLLTATYALGWITGVDGPAGANVDSAAVGPRPLALGDSAIMYLAATASPGVTASDAVAVADRAALRAARTQYVPTITATGGYNWAANSNVITTGSRPGWTVSVGTSYPLFTGFQREDVVVRAEVASDVARVAASDARRAGRASAALFLSTLRTAETSIALGAESVRSAGEDLRVQLERYHAGISTMLDVLTSERALVQAEYTLVFARHRYNTTRAALEALIGRRL